jgi:hypothetical protein
MIKPETKIKFMKFIDAIALPVCAVFLLGCFALFMLALEGKFL